MDKKKVAGRLLRLRGMRSQEEVAAALGIRQSTLAMYESGARTPRRCACSRRRDSSGWRT